MSEEYSNPSLIILNELSLPILVDCGLTIAFVPKLFAVAVERPVTVGYIL